MGVLIDSGIQLVDLYRGSKGQLLEDVGDSAGGTVSGARSGIRELAAPPRKVLDLAAERNQVSLSPKVFSPLYRLEPSNDESGRSFASRAGMTKLTWTRSSHAPTCFILARADAGLPFMTSWRPTAQCTCRTEFNCHLKRLQSSRLSEMQLQVLQWRAEKLSQ